MNWTKEGSPSLLIAIPATAGKLLQLPQHSNQKQPFGRPAERTDRKATITLPSRRTLCAAGQIQRERASAVLPHGETNGHGLSATEGTCLGSVPEIRTWREEGQQRRLGQTVLDSGIFEPADFGALGGARTENHAAERLQFDIVDQQCNQGQNTALEPASRYQTQIQEKWQPVLVLVRECAVCVRLCEKQQLRLQLCGTGDELSVCAA